MKKLFYGIASMIVLLSQIGCSEFLDSADEIDIEVDKVTFSFPAVIAKNDTRAESETPNIFSSTRTGLDITAIGHPDIMDSPEMITGVQIERTLISIRPMEHLGGRYSVRNMSVNAAGIPGSLLIEGPFAIGQKHISEAEDNDYLAEFVKRLVEGEVIDVTVRGETDAPELTNINIDLECFIVFTANPLESKD